MAESGSEKNGWGGRWERFGLYAVAALLGLVVFIYREDRSQHDARVTSLELRVQSVADLQRDKMYLVHHIERMVKVEESLADRLVKLETDFRVLQADLQTNKALMQQLPELQRRFVEVTEKLDRLFQREGR